MIPNPPDPLKTWIICLLEFVAGAIIWEGCSIESKPKGSAIPGSSAKRTGSYGWGGVINNLWFLIENDVMRAITNVLVETH